MRKNYKYTLFIALTLIAWGCNPAINDDDNEGIQGEKILLTSLANTSVETGVRAVSDFPNNGSIGLVASTNIDSLNPANNWNTYMDINNAEAVATSENNGVFGFTWREQKYWPFDGSDLYFMAYSPAVTDQIHYLLSNDRTSLTIALDPGTPDVMYASNNNNFQAYNKTSGVVNLGEFRHILSRLTVEVIANADMSGSIVVSNLSVSTPMRTASYLLYGGDDALTVYSAEIDYVATLASGAVEFKNQPFSNTMLIFPGIQDQVLVSITLVDTSNGLDYSADFMVSFFTNELNEPVILERAKNTVLRIYVSNIGVDDPDRNIQLEGTLREWEYRGDFGISIN